jgi:hypothetical protein
MAETPVDREADLVALTADEASNFARRTAPEQLTEKYTAVTQARDAHMACYGCAAREVADAARALDGKDACSKSASSGLPTG